MMRMGSPGDARPERSAQHRRGEDHDHHSFRSSSVSHAQGHAPERAKERRTREQVLPGGRRMKDTGSREQQDHVQGEERDHAVDELQTRGGNTSAGIR